MVLQSTQTKRAWAKDGKPAPDSREKSVPQRQARATSPKDRKPQQAEKAARPEAPGTAELSGASVAQRLAAVLRAEGLEPALENSNGHAGMEVIGKDKVTVLPCAWGHSFGDLPAPPEVPPALPRKVLAQYQHGLTAAYQCEHRGGGGFEAPGFLHPRMVDTAIPAGVNEEPVTRLLAKQQDSTLLMRAFQAWSGFRLQGALQTQQDRAETLRTRAASQEDNMVAMEKMVVKLWKQEAGVLKSSCISACRDVASSLLDEVKQTREEFRQQLSQRAEAGIQHSSARPGKEAVAHGAQAPDEWVERALLEARIECERLHLAQIERERLEQERSEKERSKCAEAVRVAQQERVARQRVQQLLEQERLKAREHEVELARQSTYERQRHHHRPPQDLHRAEYAARDLTSEVLAAAKHSAAEEARRCMESRISEIEELQQRQGIAEEIAKKAKLDQEEMQRELALERQRRWEMEELQLKHGAAAEEIVKKAQKDQEEMQRELERERQRRAAIEQQQLQQSTVAEQMLKKAKLDQEEIERELSRRRREETAAEEMLRKAQLEQADMQKQLEQERQRRAEVEQLQQKYGEVAEGLKKARLDKEEIHRELQEERHRRAGLDQPHQRQAGQPEESFNKASRDEANIQRELMQEHQRLRADEEKLRQQQICVQEQEQCQRSDRVARELTSEVVAAARQSATEEARRCIESRRDDIEAFQQRQQLPPATTQVLPVAVISHSETARGAQDHSLRTNVHLTQATEELTAKVISAAQVAAREESMRWMRSASSTPPVAASAAPAACVSADVQSAHELENKASLCEFNASTRTAPRAENWQSSSLDKGLGLLTTASLGDLGSGSWPLYATLQASQSLDMFPWQQRQSSDRDDSKAAEREQQRLHRAMQEREQERKQLAQSEKTKSEQADRVQRARSRRQEMLTERAGKVRGVSERLEDGERELQQPRPQQEREQERKQLVQFEKTKSEQADRVQRARSRRQEMLTERADKVRGVRERLEEQHARLEQVNNERIESIMAAAKKETQGERLQPSRITGSSPRKRPVSSGGNACMYVADRLFNIIDSDRDGAISQAEFAMAFAGDLTPAAEAQTTQATSWFGWSSWEVKLEKEDGQRLGIEYLLEDSDILVEAIHPGGLISEWNQRHPGLQVRVGDCIVAVNDCYGDGEDLLETIRISRTLLMAVEGNRPEVELELLSEDERADQVATPTWSIHEAAGMSPPGQPGWPTSPSAAMPNSPLTRDVVRSPQSAQAKRLETPEHRESKEHEEQPILPSPATSAGQHPQPHEGSISPAARHDKQRGHHSDSLRPSSPPPPPLVVAAQFAERAATVPAADAGLTRDESMHAGPFSWPTWALDPDGAVEVLVEAEEGASRWVAGAPTSRVLDEDGNDALLTVRYLWADGDVYEEDFPPTFVRPCR